MDKQADQAQRVALLLERLAREWRDHGGDLNPAQRSALRYFQRANQRSRTASAFARFHGSTRGTATQTVKSLVGKGYLRRRAVPGDARKVRLEVTESGQQALRGDLLDALTAATASLPAASTQALADGLAALVQALTADQGNPIGNCHNCTHLQAASPSTPPVCARHGERLSAATLDSLCIDHEPR